MNPQSFMTTGIMLIAFAVARWACGAAGAYEQSAFLGGLFGIGVGIGWMVFQRDERK